MQRFGWSRLMIGSDWPVCTLSGDYKSVMQIVIGLHPEIPARSASRHPGRQLRALLQNSGKRIGPTMNAAVLHGPRDIRIESYPEPRLQPGSVLLRNRRMGICGSDLHYYQEGQNGSFVPDRPFVLGHELSAEVAAVAPGVESVKIGDRVTVNPARSCGLCAYCKAGKINLCPKVIMLGSASTRPPTDGVFAEFVTVRADQCYSSAARSR